MRTMYHYFRIIFKDGTESLVRVKYEKYVTEEEAKEIVKKEVIEQSKEDFEIERHQAYSLISCLPFEEVTSQVQIYRVNKQ